MNAAQHSIIKRATRAVVRIVAFVAMHGPSLVRVLDATFLEYSCGMVLRETSTSSICEPSTCESSEPSSESDETKRHDGNDGDGRDEGGEGVHQLMFRHQSARIHPLSAAVATRAVTELARCGGSSFQAGAVSM